MHGTIQALTPNQTQTQTLRADVVIIGTGAGGGMAAYELARAGVSVIALEAGPHLRPQDMTQREDDMIPQLFAEAGGRATNDFAINILQGRGVGGSTLHNTNLCKRLPPDIRQQWISDFGLDVFSDASLDADFEAVEQLLNVHPVPDDRVNANNRVLERGINALGYRGGRLSHNRDERCQKSGFCELGCAYNGKLNAYRACIIPALTHGLNVFTGARATRILLKKGRAVGVEGDVINPLTNQPEGRFLVHASAVVLAASATGSAALALQSRLPDPHRVIGQNLRMHPGCVVMGLMDEPIEGWKGNPQSIECTEFLDFSKNSERRTWLVSGFAHPAGAATFMPGFGSTLAALMRHYDRCACVISMIHDHSSGQVRPGDGEHIDITYTLNAGDRAQIALGLHESARLLLAAGAQKALIPINGGLWIDNPTQLSQIRPEHISPQNPVLSAVHPMGTLRMSADPRKGFVNGHGAAHGIPGLFVADGSLFPTSIGGPPQVTIYTMGKRVAREIIRVLGTV